MAAFEYRQAQEIRDTFKRHGVKYLFIGKSGAILLGYPDTTQDADLFIEKNASNCEMLVQSLLDIGFQLTDQQAQEVRREKGIVQLKNGPFDLDLIFAPEGIENFDDAWKRRRAGIAGTLVTHALRLRARTPRYLKSSSETTAAASPSAPAIADQQAPRLFGSASRTSRVLSIFLE